MLYPLSYEGRAGGRMVGVYRFDGRVTASYADPTVRFPFRLVTGVARFRR